mmetsp:Transcript_27377/g.60548  ORF Transcript_27377/g.60548 Transcript_27377/m.60548 type:complete len:616 (+) Transcript_27377:64-1911(+)
MASLGLLNQNVKPTGSPVKNTPSRFGSSLDRVTPARSPKDLLYIETPDPFESTQYRGREMEPAGCAAVNLFAAGRLESPAGPAPMLARIPSAESDECLPTSTAGALAMRQADILAHQEAQRLQQQMVEQVAQQHLAEQAAQQQALAAHFVLLQQAQFVDSSWDCLGMPIPQPMHHVNLFEEAMRMEHSNLQAIQAQEPPQMPQFSSALQQADEAWAGIADGLGLSGRPIDVYSIDHGHHLYVEPPQHVDPPSPAALRVQQDNRRPLHCTENVAQVVKKKDDRRQRAIDDAQLAGTIVAKAKDQTGCRNLQRKISDENASPELLEMICEEIVPAAAELMADPFGNYLMQMLLKKFTVSEVQEVFRLCEKSLVDIARNMHGTRAVQELISNLPTDQDRKRLVAVLKPHVVTLAKDLNGNHVIARCLTALSPADNDFVFVAMRKNCREVATHKQGCCVLQRCLDAATDSQRTALLEAIAKNALPLSQDAFGNYVVQCVLKSKHQDMIRMVGQQLKGRVAELSKQKFSSNVVEKLVQSEWPGVRDPLIKEVVDSGVLPELMNEQYGNFVAQSMLLNADGAILEQTLAVLRRYISRGGSVSARAWQKVFKRCPQLSECVP